MSASVHRSHLADENPTSITYIPVHRTRQSWTSGFASVIAAKVQLRHKNFPNRRTTEDGQSCENNGWITVRRYTGPAAMRASSIISNNFPIL